MVNGAYLSFPNGQQPYAMEGVTYVPAGVLGEALGLTLTGDYAPLRETAEAAGYLVWWDPAYETAVLMDPAALAEAVDSRAVSGALSVLTPEGGSRSPATRLALSWNATADRGTVELEYHIKNQMKLVVNITSTLSNTTAQPETLPPEDAAALPAA